MHGAPAGTKALSDCPNRTARARRTQDTAPRCPLQKCRRARKTPVPFSYVPICTAVGVAGEPADGTLILSAHLYSRVRCTSSQGGHKDRAYNNGLAM